LETAGVENSTRERVWWLQMSFYPLRREQYSVNPSGGFEAEDRRGDGRDEKRKEGKVTRVGVTRGGN